jgi:hypothetical protein
MTGALVQIEIFSADCGQVCIFFSQTIWGGGDFSYVLQPYLAVNYGVTGLHKFPKIQEPSQTSKCQNGSVLSIYKY